MKKLLVLVSVIGLLVTLSVPQNIGIAAEGWPDLPDSVGISVEA